MDEVKGYKAFNKNATNRYGMPFAEGETYKVTGEIRFGNDGNGFHMCTALSDVFRFVNAIKDEVLVAEVTGKGKRVARDDIYYGYYDMYCVEEITIDRFLSREEIISMMLNSPSYEVMKFFITFRLTESEKILFARKFRNDVNVMKSLLYYQYGCTDVYKDEYNFGNEYMRLVLKYGQDNNKGSKGK